MREIRVVGAGFITAIAVVTITTVLALGGAQAQTAASEPVGKPLALLAGLRPPHEPKHAVHAKATHSASRKTAARTSHHVRAAAEHSRHAASEKDRKAAARSKRARRHRLGLRRRAAASSGAGRVGMMASTPVASPVSQPVSENAPAPGASPDPTAVKVETLRIAAPNPDSSVAPSAPQDAPPVAATNDSSIAPPSPQSVLAAPIHHDTSQVGSAAWIAQVLAAFGGAVAAGAVAWFLIGGGPVRTYG